MKHAVLAAAFCGLSAAPAAADIVPLRDLSNYFNGLQVIEASFSQINADGTISDGELFMHRPGRARFDYDGDDLLVIAGGGQVAIFDGRSNTRPEQYPLRETPLALILDANVNLDRSDMIVSHSFDGTATRVVAVDPDRPEIGSLELFFTSDPVALRQWVITDSSGSQTTVVLDAFEERSRLASRLFNIPLEIRARTPDED